MIKQINRIKHIYSSVVIQERKIGLKKTKNGFISMFTLIFTFDSFIYKVYIIDTLKKHWHLSL